MESILIVANFACAMYVCGKNIRSGCSAQFFEASNALEKRVNGKSCLYCAVRKKNVVHHLKCI